MLGLNFVQITDLFRLWRKNSGSNYLITVVMVLEGDTYC